VLLTFVSAQWKAPKFSSFVHKPSVMTPFIGITQAAHIALHLSHDFVSFY
jgi:hypothetical protein